MLLTLSLAALLSSAPQGKVLAVVPFEAEGASAMQVAMVRTAVMEELVAQGYAIEGAAPAGTVGGAVVQLNGIFQVTLRLTDAKTNAVISAVNVRAGAAGKLSEAAKEAVVQLAREGRQQWGLRTRFKVGK